MGIVSSIGPDVRDVSENDKVFVYSTAGTWANATTTEENKVMKIKAPISPETASLYPVALNAWAMLTQFVQLQTGATVIADSLTTATGKVVKELGDLMGVKVVEYKPFSKDVAPVQASLVLCGQPTLLRDILKHNVTKGGTVVLYEPKLDANTHIEPVTIPYSAQIFHDVHVVGFDLDTWIQGHPDQFRRGVKVIDDFIGDKKLTVPNVPAIKIGDVQAALANYEKDSLCVLKM